MARLFTVPRLPELWFGARATRVRCHDRGSVPGRGGRWYFWLCSLRVRDEARSVDVMWQVADPEDAGFASVEARDRHTAQRLDGCCIERPLNVRRREVEELFTKPSRTLLHPGDGVIDAGCRPAERDPTGLGNPWRCTLELDSEGRSVHLIRVFPNGRFSSRWSGRGCCVPVAPAR